MITTGFWIEDPADPAGVLLLANTTGVHDDVMEEDPNDAQGVVVRSAPLTDAHLPLVTDVKSPTVYGWDNELVGVLP